MQHQLLQLVTVMLQHDTVRKIEICIKHQTCDVN